MRSDPFILVSGDVVSNIDLKPVIKEVGVCVTFTRRGKVCKGVELREEEGKGRCQLPYPLVLSPHGKLFLYELTCRMKYLAQVDMDPQ